MPKNKTTDPTAPRVVRRKANVAPRAARKPRLAVTAGVEMTAPPDPAPAAPPPMPRERPAPANPVVAVRAAPALARLSWRGLLARAWRVWEGRVVALRTRARRPLPWLPTRRALGAAFLGSPLGRLLRLR